MTDPQFYHATGNIRALWNPNGTMFNSSDAEFIQMKHLVCISDSILMIKSGCDWRSWETLGMRRKHVALDDILGWRNQSDRLKNFAKLSLHNLTSSLSESIIAFSEDDVFCTNASQVYMWRMLYYWLCQYLHMLQINHPQQKSFYVFIPTDMKRKLIFIHIYSLKTCGHKKHNV